MHVQSVLLLIYPSYYCLFVFDDPVVFFFKLPIVVVASPLVYLPGASRHCFRCCCFAPI